jgi:hypothetical protein
MKCLKCLILCASIALLLGGCAHKLEVKNLNDYQVHSLPTKTKGVSIGVIQTSDRAKLLTRGIVGGLTKYADRVVYPFTMSKSSEVDLIAKITINERHKGSGANFFINFPGFLVWAPAWNGYVYKPSYDVIVDLVKADTGERLDTLTIPIEFDVRQAEFDRTWTEISWLESGIIAFIGGFVAMTYDEDITPSVEREVKSTVGDYVAAETMKSLKESLSSPTVRQ